MEKRLTKKDLFGMIREIEEVKSNQTLVNFIDHELELLDKKSSRSGQTKTQKENEDLKVTIKEELARINKPVTISELQEQSEVLSDFSNQKLSALLTQLKNSNEVVNIKDKKKSYFSIA